MDRSIIAAPATPRGRGALAVVRFSGDDITSWIYQLVRPLSGRVPEVGRVARVALFDAEGDYDDGLLVIGKSPRTYTGEDTAEVSCHGNPVIVDRLIDAAISAGARLADPGEFTARALLSGKLDLVGAEAVHLAVEAASLAGLRVARAGAEGRIQAFSETLRGKLLGVGAELEARLDYPDESLTYRSDEELLADLSAVEGEARALADTWTAGRVRVQGAKVALVGPVNAGKSSLFNALLGKNRALVHASPGTTRDVVEAPTVIGDLLVTLLDTAGERVTIDPVEAAGLALARELTAEADLLLVVIPATEEEPAPEVNLLLERTQESPRILVYNGVDRPHTPPPAGALLTSARRGDGVEALKAAIAERLSAGPSKHEGLTLGSARQRERFLGVARAAREAAIDLQFAGVAAASDAVIRAIEELDALTGADAREDVRSELFARFCVGK